MWHHDDVTPPLYTVAKATTYSAFGRLDLLWYIALFVRSELSTHSTSAKINSFYLHFFRFVRIGHLSSTVLSVFSQIKRADFWCENEVTYFGMYGLCRLLLATGVTCTTLTAGLPYVKCQVKVEGSGMSFMECNFIMHRGIHIVWALGGKWFCR